MVRGEGRLFPALAMQCPLPEARSWASDRARQLMASAPCLGPAGSPPSSRHVVLQPLPARCLRPNPARQQLQRAVRPALRRLQRCHPALASAGDAAGPDPQLLPAEHSRGIQRLGCRGQLSQRCQRAHRFGGLPGAGGLWLGRAGPGALRGSGTWQSLVLKPVHCLPLLQRQQPPTKPCGQPGERGCALQRSPAPAAPPGGRRLRCPSLSPQQTSGFPFLALLSPHLPPLT